MTIEWNAASLALMLDRRKFLALTAAASVAKPARAENPKRVARLALTFDYHPQVVAACEIMSALGIFAATYYAWYPNIVDASVTPVDPNYEHISAADVTSMKQLGWEIGAYTNQNMLKKFANNKVDANNFLREIDNGMNAAGFKVETIAPNQRAWNQALANLARGRFKSVRVADVINNFQQYPIEDPLYIRNGGANPWGYGSDNTGSDSPSVILSRIDRLIDHGGLGIEIVHKIGPVGDGFTFTTSDFTSVMNGIAARVKSGNLQLVTMSQAIA